MADRCKHQDCNRWAMVLSGDGLCFDHSSTVTDAERRAAKVKGGKASKKVHPLALPDIERIDTTGDLKTFTVSVIRALVNGTVTPNQARALFTGSITLKSILELELYERLAQRVATLETGTRPTPKELEAPEETLWQESEI